MMRYTLTDLLIVLLPETELLFDAFSKLAICDALPIFVSLYDICFHAVTQMSAYGDVASESCDISTVVNPMPLCYEL